MRTRPRPRSSERADFAGMRALFLAALVAALTPFVLVPSPGIAGEEVRPLVLHVKTALSIDDAQICVVPNVAWAALAAGRPVTIVFDGSAVTSVAKGYGWRGWFGIETTAMDRAALPERERKALAETFGVPLETVPANYGEYLRLVEKRGAKVYYNTTMALLYQIPPERIDGALTPLGLKELLAVLGAPGTYLVY